MHMEAPAKAEYSIVFDMEWNQPLPWREYPKVPKALMPGEIIQIGAVKLDASMRVVGEFRASVRPRFFRQVHWKVQKLTHISKEDMLGGLEFPEAARQFGEWCLRDGAPFDMFAWGGEDERVLVANLEAWGLTPDWLPDTVYDLRLIYDSLNGRTENSTSLTDAAAALGVALDMEQHDSLNDARYAAAVCAGTDVRRGVAEYEELGPGPAPGAPVQRLRVTGLPAPELPKAGALLDFTCPVCGEALCCRSWAPQNKDRQIGLARCKAGHESFLRVRFSRRPDGRFAALRSVYPADEATAAFYQKKYQRQQENIRRARRAAEKARKAAEGGGEA